MQLLVRKYFRVWLMIATNTIQETFINRGAHLFFLVGKLLRLGLWVLFLFILRTRVSEVGGYSPDQMVVFFITYQLLDTVGQTLYRGVYNFGNLVRNGTFDGILTKPLNPLFRILTGEPDVTDAIFLIPFGIISGWLLSQGSLEFSLSSALWYLALLWCAFVLVTAFHIIIASITMLTLDVDNLIFLYRDLARLTQLPMTIYGQTVRFILFFIVPIGLMVTVPAQALLALPTSVSLSGVILITIFFLGVSLQIWQRALRRYSSASS